MNLRLLFLTLNIFCLTADLSAQNNGIVIEARFKSTRLCSSDSSSNRITYHIRKDILRVDLSGASAQSSIIYQKESGKIWVLFHVEQVYYSMEAHEMQTITEEVQKQSEDFINSVNQLDEKSKAETMLVFKEGNPFVFEDPAYVLVAKKDSLVSQLLCNKFKGQLSNGNDQLIYLSDLKSTGIKDEELVILNSFSDFMGKGVKALSGSMDFCAIRKRPQGGYPVLIENRSGKVLCNSYQLNSIYRNHLPDTLFQIPLAFGKFDNPLGR